MSILKIVRDAFAEVEPKVGQKWKTPGGQVYEILEDTGDSFRCDVHDEKGGLTPNSWTFSKEEFARMIRSFPLETTSLTTMPPGNYPGFRGPGDDPRRSIAAAKDIKIVGWRKTKYTEEFWVKLAEQCRHAILHKPVKLKIMFKTVKEGWGKAYHSPVNGWYEIELDPMWSIGMNAEGLAHEIAHVAQFLRGQFPDDSTRDAAERDAVTHESIGKRILNQMIRDGWKPRFEAPKMGGLLDKNVADLTEEELQQVIKMRKTGASTLNHRMRTEDKQQIIATLLKAQRPDLANVISRIPSPRLIHAGDPLAGINENQQKMESIYKAINRLENKHRDDFREKDSTPKAEVPDGLLGKFRQRVVEIQKLVESSLVTLRAFQKISEGPYRYKAFKERVELLDKIKDKLDHILKDPVGYTEQHESSAAPANIVMHYRILVRDAWQTTRASLTIGRALQQDLESGQRR